MRGSRVRSDGAQRKRRGDRPDVVSRVRVRPGLRRVGVPHDASSVVWNPVEPRRRIGVVVAVGMRGEVRYQRGRVRVKRRFPPTSAHRGRPRLSRGPAGVVPAPHAVKRAAPIVEQQTRSPREIAKHREDHRALPRFNLLRVARVGHRLLVAGDEPNVA